MLDSKLIKIIEWRGEEEVSKPFKVHDKIYVTIGSKWYEFPTWNEAYDFYYNELEERENTYADAI